MRPPNLGAVIQDITTSAAASLATGLSAIADAASASTLDDVRRSVLDKSAPLSALKKQLGSLDSPDDKKAAGQVINDALAAIESAYGLKRAALLATEIASQLAAEAMDLTEVIGGVTRGVGHISTQIRHRLEDVFVGMGFNVAEGPEVESDWSNFEALNIPAGHPARSMWDTFFLNLGGMASDKGDNEQVVLRTHTSPVQIRTMLSQAPPIYIIAPGRVFRNDTPDATHMPVFHQIEGLVIDKGITMGHLAGCLEQFTKAFFGDGFTSRLRPSYFPFTEPSAEFDVRRPDGSWLELGGCGMVHPTVLANCGIDPEEFSGFAFGFGIDRFAIIHNQVSDIRDLFTNDVRVLEQFV